MIILWCLASSSSSTCNGATTTSRVVGFQHANGWLTGVTGFASSIGYHPNGMLSNVVHTDGTTYAQAADPTGMRRPASYTVTKTATGAAMWQSGAYAYDGAGNVTSIGGAAYSYDAVSRLVSGTTYTAPVSGGSHLGQTAVYDPFGNLTTLSTEVSVNNWSGLNLLTSTSTNRLTSFPYDNSGAMTSWTGQSYHRDDLGLVWRYEAAGLSYVHIYTADDERLWTFHEGQNRSRWTLRDLDGKVLRELDNQGGTWTVQRDYVHRDGAPLAAVQSNGLINHLHPDHLGTPRLVTTDYGYGTGPTQVAFHAYHPYGTEATYFAQDDERMKFTGHERDLGVTWSSADDVDYMHARYYQAQVGRFLSVDRVDGISRAPLSWNRYAYARGNPLKYIDPTGNYVVSCAKGDKGCAADAAAFEEARQENIGSSDEAVAAAALAYGDPGVDNGITVAFGNPGVDIDGSVEATLDWKEQNAGMGMKATVTMKTGLRGTALTAAVAHEGQHLLDAAGFAASFSPDLSSWDSSKNMNVRQTETNAFRLTHSVYRRNNATYTGSCGAGCRLGSGVKTSSDVERAINRILTDPRGSYNDKLDRRQFPGW